MSDFLLAFTSIFTKFGKTNLDFSKKNYSHNLKNKF